ncbi:hypothetical protein GBAR_LOCUS13314 [Geodia barretti]|uniref:Uncharacterized protein n=1 Tax=Geodia barretti TaxID=519541 RepID=A0AA35WQK3_GEOBA|nr:hypothetical protein GBAR_LOCUS13314 [Geodia barretti]
MVVTENSKHDTGRIQDFVWEGATTAHAQRSCRAQSRFSC